MVGWHRSDHGLTRVRVETQAATSSAQTAVIGSSNPHRDALKHFDQVFNVIEDRGGDIARGALAWGTRKANWKRQRPHCRPRSS